MTLEQIKQLPEDAELIVWMSYKYSKDEVSQELLDFWNSKGAEFTNSYDGNNSEITEDETHIH
jgi:gas vesicle protein